LVRANYEIQIMPAYTEQRTALQVPLDAVENLSLVKSIYLGSFRDPKSAHAAYCAVVKEHHGKFGRVA
jgi:hypothetical protein